MVSNTKTIQVNDFGAGSKVFTSNERKISKIVAVAGISTKRAKLLMRLITYFNSKNILEIGTSVGLATAAMALANKNSRITTLEGCSETSKVASQAFKKFDLNNITPIVGDFKNTLKDTVFNNQYDIIFFDGNHQKEATLEYFNTCLHCIHNDTLFIFDDIHWSKEMEDAWTEIKMHPKVTVTIDTYQWGLVFFRKEQEKEHFIIRV